MCLFKKFSCSPVGQLKDSCILRSSTIASSILFSRDLKLSHGVEVTLESIEEGSDKED